MALRLLSSHKLVSVDFSINNLFEARFSFHGPYHHQATMLFFSSQCQVARFYETKLKIRVYTFSYLSLSAFYLRFIPYQGIRMSHLSYSSAKNPSGHSHYHLLRRGPRRRCSSAHIVGTWYKMLIVIKVSLFRMLVA